MELQFSFCTLTLTLTLIFLFFICVALKKIERSEPTSKLPPGPWKLPLIGNLHQMVGSLPHIALANLAKKHGPLMYLQLGEIPTIVVSSADYAKEVMKTHDIVFASRPQLNAAKVISYSFTSIAFAPYGEYWRQLRKICVVELLSAKRVESLRPIREEEMSNFINSVSLKIGESINLTDLVFSAIYTSVSKMLFRDKAENTDELISMVRESSRLAAGFNIADVLPSFRFLQLLSGISSELEIFHKTSSIILGNIIDRHLQAQPSKHGDEDLVDVLLKFHGNDIEFSLTKDNIKAVIQDIIGGGGDTSAAAVDWAMVEIIKDTRVMKKVQAEVRRVFDSKAKFDETGIAELQYLKLVIKETLRLHPSVPLLLPRENSERCKINGYEIPLKTRVIINAFAIGRDPEYWVDPDRFYPERFLDKDIDFKDGNFEYIPFGAGRRMCPGITFGLTNVEFLVSQLLYYFDWKLPDDSEELDMAATFGVAMRRRDDLYLIPTLYHP